MAKSESTKSSSSEGTPMEALVGFKLLTKVGQPEKNTSKLFQDKDLVCLYFSASWCPPCKAFSPVLAEFYNACAKQGKMEIVYISSDKTIPDFEGYYKQMPWLSIPIFEGAAQIKNNLSDQLKISGIPALIVLDVKTGQFITADAREEVTNVGGDKAKGMALIETWKNTESVPLSEAKLGGSNQGPLMALLKHMMKNPIHIFGVLYMLKTASKYVMGPPQVPAAKMYQNIPVKDEPQNMESEF